MNKFLKVLKGIGKGIGATLMIIVSLALTVVISLNVLKFGIYSEYYSLKKDVASNPGLNDGFIPQGIATSETDNFIVTSGYMGNKKASRVYVKMLDEKKTYHLELTKGGQPFKGHCGGIAYNEGTSSFYLANGGKIYTIPKANVISTSNKTLEIGEGVAVNNAASFVYSVGDYVYVGEFHNGKQYITNHPVTQKDGSINHAIVTKYSVSDLSTPISCLSLINKVQGFCVTPSGKLVLSTSYGLASSEYYVYDNDVEDSGETIDGVKVYLLKTLVNKITGPSMSEDLSYYKGRVVTLTESASNKYIFGKLFNATKIIGLKIA